MIVVIITSFTSSRAENYRRRGAELIAFDGSALADKLSWRVGENEIFLSFFLSFSCIKTSVDVEKAQV